MRKFEVVDTGGEESFGPDYYTLLSISDMIAECEISLTDAEFDSLADIQVGAMLQFGDTQIIRRA